MKQALFVHVHKIVLVSLAALLLLGCTATPDTTAPQDTLSVPQHDITTVRTSLEERCWIIFEQQSSDGATIHLRGIEPEGIVIVDLWAVNNVFTRGLMTIQADTSPPWMGYSSYTGTCIWGLTLPLNLPRSLLDWYRENDETDAQMTADALNISTIGQADGSRLFEVVVLNGDQSAVENRPPVALGIDSGACGSAVVFGLGGQRLNLRGNPGLASQIVGKLAEGQTVQTLCDEPQTVDGVRWVKILADIEGTQVEGWVSQEYLRIR